MQRTNIARLQRNSQGVGKPPARVWKTETALTTAKIYIYTFSTFEKGRDISPPESNISLFQIIIWNFTENCQMILHFFSPQWELGDQTPLRQANNTYPRTLLAQTCWGTEMAPALLRVPRCPEEQPGSCTLAHPQGLAEAYQPLPLAGMTTASKAGLPLPPLEKYL